MARYADDMLVDKKEQLEKIDGVCLSDEMIRAVFDMRGRGSRNRARLIDMLVGRKNPGLLLLQ